MLIEADARKYITDAIELERDLQSLEIREKAKGRILIDSEDYHHQRGKLVKQLAVINGVANSEGKGRDDLSVDILLQSEQIIRRVSPDQSKAVRNLAQQIRNTFTSFRELLQKYDQNIEVVDPQLKNNPDLVEVLLKYETAWEKGKNYFLETGRSGQIIHISQFLEGLCEKHPLFAEQVECRDSSIFVTIPGLLLLKYLENDDKKICVYFLPELLDDGDERAGKVFSQLKMSYEQGKGFFPYPYQYHNFLEKLILSTELTKGEQELYKSTNLHPLVDSIINKIQGLSIEMQRKKPSEFNDFLDIVLGS